MQTRARELDLCLEVYDKRAISADNAARYSSFISIWSCFAEPSVVVMFGNGFDWIAPTIHISNDAAVYTYVNHTSLTGANPPRAEIPHAPIYDYGSWSFCPPPICWYTDKNVWRAASQHVIAFLKLLRNAKLSDTKCSTWDASYFSSHETSFILWCLQYYDRQKDISVWGTPRSFLYMSLDVSFAIWKKKEKRKYRDRRQAVRACATA